MDKPHNRRLLYLDFLGFSEKILSQNIEDSINYYKTILGDFEIVTNNSKFKINFDVVSDSAFLWIDGEDLFSTTAKLFQIASTLLHNSLLLKRPIRGSLVYDEFIIGDKEFDIRKNKINTHLILGKGIIGGYRWEQVQDWFGISINPLYLNTFDEKLPNLLETLSSVNYLVPYDVPTKYGEIKSLVVNGFFKSHSTGLYVDSYRGKIREQQVETYSETFKELKKTIKDFSVLNKLTNTEKFLEYVSIKNLTRNTSESITI